MDQLSGYTRGRALLRHFWEPVSPQVTYGMAVGCPRRRSSVSIQRVYESNELILIFQYFLSRTSFSTVTHHFRTVVRQGAMERAKRRAEDQVGSLFTQKFISDTCIMCQVTREDPVEISDDEEEVVAKEMPKASAETLATRQFA